MPTTAPAAVMVQPQKGGCTQPTKGIPPGAPGLGDQNGLQYRAPQDAFIKPLLSRPKDLAVLVDT